ncbi:MAG: Flp pilus assembly complex ATPase component TadA [Bacteroidetes bacterium]|nr:Flp pilus assembly complex ATPase component TadA [Bacteroidota bacterium]
MSLTAEHGTATRANGKRPEIPPVPEAVNRIVASCPPNLDGLDKMEWYAEQVNALDPAVREEMRKVVDGFVARMPEYDASDLDFGAEACNGMIWYRLDGLKVPKPELGTYDSEVTNVLLLNLMFPRQQDRLFRKYALDYGSELDMGPDEPPRRFRTTVFFDNRQLALSQRMLAWKPRPLRSLGFHPLVERGLMFRYLRDGLTLITGVTGSGKSTTLDSIVNANNNDIEAQIIIIAQPLEFIHKSNKCVVRHREVGTDVESYVDGMVQALRQDPDIVVVGEMRDAESISTAMEMADTGHKVFSTLHTGSAPETIDRIVAEYPPSEQDRIRYRLADVLRCIVSQKLLPAVGGGRILAKEVMWMTPAARAAIKNGNIGEIYQMMWAGADQGQITLEQDLARLLQNGDITAETAVSYANNKRRLLQIIQ